MIDVPRLSLVLILGIRVSGLALALFRSKRMSAGRSSSGRLGQLGHDIFLRLEEGHLDAKFFETSWILARMKRSSIKQ